MTVTIKAIVPPSPTCNDDVNVLGIGCRRVDGECRQTIDGRHTQIIPINRDGTRIGDIENERRALHLAAVEQDVDAVLTGAIRREANLNQR